MRSQLDFGGHPDELDPAILSRDASVSVLSHRFTELLDGDKGLIKHECLRFGGLPWSRSSPSSCLAPSGFAFNSTRSYPRQRVSIPQEETEFRPQVRRGEPCHSFAQLASVLHVAQSCEGTAQKKTLRSLATTSMMSSLIFSTSSRVLNVRSHLPLRVTRGSPWHRT